MIYCVGLTGSIASGKSLVLSLFAKQGIEVISADEIAKTLTLPQEPAFESIIAYFGSQILAPNGMIDRRCLRQLIFEDPIKRQWLEQLLHPLIRTRIIETIPNCQSPYCMIEIPLLFQRSDYSYLNRVLVLLAPFEQRLQRLMKRDNCTEKQALDIFAVQATDVAYQAIADDVMINDANSTELEKKLMQLHKKYLHEALK